MKRKSKPRTCRCGCGREARYLFTGHGYGTDRFLVEPCCRKEIEYLIQMSEEANLRYTITKL